jgi:hypothetical protein
MPQRTLCVLRRPIHSNLAAVGTTRLSMCRPKDNTINRNRLEHLYLVTVSAHTVVALKRP